MEHNVDVYLAVKGLLLEEVMTGTVVDGSLSTFADDVARKVPVRPEDSLEQVKTKVAAVNESYRAASWRRGYKLNSDKQVEVPTLLSKIKGYNYSKGDKRVKAKATYLGAQFPWNARAGAEISKRINAMKAAWSRMGRF